MTMVAQAKMSNSQMTVVLRTDEPNVKGAVSAVLGIDGEFALQTVNSFQDLIVVLEREPVAVALVDIDPDPERTLEVLEQAIVRFPQTRFVTMADEMRNELVLTAMKAGARYFLVKRNISPELVDVMHRLVSGDVKTSRGIVVTVLSAGGGCGATTLAINLANELHLAGESQSLLVDMDCSYGGVAKYLGLQGQFGLADVLMHPQQIDRQLVRTATTGHSDGLRVLLSPASTNFSSPLPLHTERLEAALGIFKQVWPYTVIDAPRVSMEVAASLGKVSKLVLIVFQMNVKDLRILQAMTTALVARGVPREVIVPLANRTGSKRTFLNMEDVRQIAGNLPITEVENDYRAASKALNFGHLLSDKAPRSSMRRNIQQLATRILDSIQSAAPVGAARKG
jgi:pilus assembly protein CpaE